MPKIKVFISYSHEDLRIVNPIISIIRTMSEKVFRDRDNIRPGDKWEISIENALEQCEKMILFWCIHSSRSPYVMHEFNAAIEKNKKLIPVLLDSTPVPKNIAQYQWIDLKELLQFRHDDEAWLRSQQNHTLGRHLTKEEAEISGRIFKDERSLAALQQLTLEIIGEPRP